VGIIVCMCNGDSGSSVFDLNGHVVGLVNGSSDGKPTTFGVDIHRMAHQSIK
jgi:hypothetical protein